MFTRSKVKLTILLERSQVRPGQELRGVLQVVVTQKVDVTAVRVRISGKEKSYIRKGGRHQKPHEFVYLEKLFTVFGFTKASGRKGGASLSPGTYDYPFHLPLPFSLPPTYFAQAKKACSVMRYCIEGIVDVPSGFDARVSRRFTVLASAPRVQIVTAHEAPAEHEGVRAMEKNGMFGKRGGFMDVTLKVAPSVVRFRSEPVESGDDDDDANDSEGDDDDSEDSEDSVSGTTAGYSGSHSQNMPGQGSPEATNSRAPPAMYRTPDPSRRALDGTGAPVTPENNFPATVARYPVVRDPSTPTPAEAATRPTAPDDVHVELPGGVSNPQPSHPGGNATSPAEHEAAPFAQPALDSAPALDRPPSLSELFAAAPEQPNSTQLLTSGCLGGTGTAAMATVTAASSSSPGPYATGQRGGSPEAAIASNPFGAVTPATPAAGIAPHPNAADAQIYHNAESPSACCPAAYSGDDDSDDSVEQPRTIPRGRRVDSFDARLREDQWPNPPPQVPLLRTTTGAPTAPRDPPAGSTNDNAGSPPVRAERQRPSRLPNRSQGASVANRHIQGPNCRVLSRCQVLPMGVPLAPLSHATADGETNVRLTIINGAKRKLKSIDIFLIELTDIAVGHRLRCGQEVVAKCNCPIPKAYRRADSLVIDATLCMPILLRTRGKKSSRHFPLPTLSTSMCKTKTCLKVHANGVKLRSPIIFSNVVHLINGIDDSNVTVPGPLLFTTQHLLPDE